MEEGNSKKFNIQVVHDKFKAALKEEDDVDLELYLESFDELNKFFTLLGSIFDFVSLDLRQKMDHLKCLLKENEAIHSVKTMIEYEKENMLLNKKGYVSGSRTLLRIHRGLDFFQLFLKKIEKLEYKETTSVACGTAYDETLAKHHSLLIRTGAKVAMYMLPTKEVLLKRVCGDEDDIKRAIALLPETLEICELVHKRVDTLYTIHDLHKLP